MYIYIINYKLYFFILLSTLFFKRDMIDLMSIFPSKIWMKITKSLLEVSPKCRILIALIVLLILLFVILFFSGQFHLLHNQGAMHFHSKLAPNIFGWYLFKWKATFSSKGDYEIEKNNIDNFLKIFLPRQMWKLY